jgi:hypothetical protein
VNGREEADSIEIDEGGINNGQGEHVNESATHSERKRKGVRDLLGYPSKLLTNEEEKKAITRARQGQLSKTNIMCEDQAREAEVGEVAK